MPALIILWFFLASLDSFRLSGWEYFGRLEASVGSLPLVLAALSLFKGLPLLVDLYEFWALVLDSLVIAFDPEEVILAL